MRPGAGPISGSTSAAASGSRWERGSSSKQQLGLVEHRAADGEPLDHAGGEVANQLAGPARHPHPVEELGDPVLGLALEPVQAGLEAQVLGAGEVAVAERLVAEVADPPPRLPGLAGQRAPEHRDLAGGGAKQGRQDPQQGRLAGAVRAQHGEGLALGQLEGEVAQSRPLAVVSPQVCERDGGGGATGARGPGFSLDSGGFRHPAILPVEPSSREGRIPTVRSADQRAWR